MSDKLKSDKQKIEFYSNSLIDHKFKTSNINFKQDLLKNFLQKIQNHSFLETNKNNVIEKV